MSALAGLLPKLLVFGVTALASAGVASIAVGALQDNTPQSSVQAAPEYLLTGPDTPSGPGVPVAFNEEPSGPPPQALPTLAPDDLTAAADALLGGEPVSYVNPSGFPRIPPITQFDGGPFQGSNCTLASTAMLARLAYGIVTTGSTLRTLQDDQDGGTDIDDAKDALWRGYGVVPDSGLIKPATLKKLLGAGYGAVVQGIYGKIPVGLRLQKDFTGGHAIYLDGYYPGSPKKGIPEAYYVIDPIGRPNSGYEGDWWPASMVDDFATSFAGGGRMAAMWAFPPGGVPPDVVGPDVLPIPPDKGGGGGPSATPTPGPSASAAASASPPASPTPAPSVTLVDSGDTTVELASAPPPIDGADDGGVILIPIFDICLIDPPPAGCPTGIEATFDANAPPILTLPPGPKVTISFVDSDRGNVALVGFTVDPPAAPADVKFWEADGDPATVMTASSMASVNLPGGPVLVAHLDVKAATTYRFQAVAGDGLGAGSSPVGSFTTGSGVEQFDVSLSQAANPPIQLVEGISPYLHLGQNAYALPMLPMADLGGASCDESATYGGVGYCVTLGGSPPPPGTCTRAEVTYQLSGIDADGVLVRAYPAEEGELPGGGMTLDGVLEATGPAGSGTVSVGCLASGLTYHIAIDATGDDRGILATKDVTVP